MSNPDEPLKLPLSWQILSSTIMGFTGSICRGFLYGFNSIQVVGLENFIGKLDERQNAGSRERGLLTVSNHISVVDDPLIWGVLPVKYAFNPSNHRWSLGSYDICFQGSLFSTIFNYGQVLPTHRSAYSTHGGLFQPVMSQAIRLLSAQPFTVTENSDHTDSSDPFTTGAMTYTTNGLDSFVSPSFYSARRYSWVHIFPEGRVHQHHLKTFRYFKWGVSRLILESEPMPEVIPIFIDGNQEVMHEDRGFPEFLPRIRKHITVAFGDSVDGEKVFGDLRKRWKQLERQNKDDRTKRGQNTHWDMGDLSDDLKYGSEAVAIRKEVTLRVRNEVLKVRRSLGYPEEDPSQALAETWASKDLQTTVSTA